MNKLLETLLERVTTWPKEAQEELMRSAIDIEAKHVGVYRLSDVEWTAVQEGLAQAERGEFVSDEGVAAFFKRHGP
jgi:hypothetical protein